MPSNSARKPCLVDTSDFDAPSEREISGVHKSALVTTAKIPIEQLERLRAIRDEDEDVQWDDVVLTTDDDPTVRAPAPAWAFGEAELPVELPAETPDSRVVMRSHVREAPRVVPAPLPAPLVRRITVPPFTPIVGVPQSTRQIGPEAIEAARVAREIARQEQQRRTRMKWLVAGIWAAAFALAGGLAWVVTHEHNPAPVVAE